MRKGKAGKVQTEKLGKVYAWGYGSHVFIATWLYFDIMHHYCHNKGTVRLLFLCLSDVKDKIHVKIKENRLI